MEIIYLYQNGICKQQLTLTENTPLIVGRKGKGADIEIDSPFVSANHLSLFYSNGVYITDLNSSNETYINTNVVPLEPQKSYLIQQNDIIFLGKNTGIFLSLKNNFYQDKNIGNTIFQYLEAKNAPIKLGRSEENDWVLNHPTVSRLHAEIFKTNDNQFFIKNLSHNGTYLNDTLFFDTQPITVNDIISICPYQFGLTTPYHALETANDTATLWIKDIQTTLDNGQRILDLKGNTLPFLQGEMIALMGPSGCGKSTLLHALNGYLPADKQTGSVKLLGFELSLANFHYLKQFIGFVPQEDALHAILTVEQCLTYAANLKLPNLTANEQLQRIVEVCDALKISEKYVPHISQKRVSELSGGQKKRLAIAIELLPQPSILLLDEPTSPLDPQSIDDFLGCLKQLTQMQQGKNPTTIVMVTHKPDDLAFMDKIVVLGAGGKLCYYGETQSLYGFFGITELKKIYAKLANANEVENWDQKWRSQQENGVLYRPIEKKILPSQPAYTFSQLITLSKRYLQIKRNDARNSLIMLLQAPIIASLMCLMFDKISLAVVFMMVISMIWFGVNNAAREIVGEKSVYERERMFNLRIFPYLSSKFLILGGFSLFQVVVFIGILAIHLSFSNILLINLLGFILVITATALGLLISTFANTHEQVMSSLPILLIPQILFAGVLTEIKGKLSFLSYATLSRWATHGIASQMGKVETILQCNHPLHPKESTALPHHLLTQEMQIDKTSIGFGGDNFILFGMFCLFLIGIIVLLHQKDKFRTLK